MTYRLEYILITLAANQQSVLDARLRKGIVLKVKMEGEGYDKVFHAPAGRQVEHKKFSGLLKFDSALDHDRNIYVLLKR